MAMILSQGDVNSRDWYCLNWSFSDLKKKQQQQKKPSDFHTLRVIFEVTEENQESRIGLIMQQQPPTLSKIQMLSFR